MSERLRAALREQARPLSQRVLDEMYENPFWMERYGERGRRYADEDSLHHISYLDQALAAGDAAVFEKYARWLRSVLVSRGMCSDHLGENFVRLAQAIEDAALPDAPQARQILDKGDAALRYEEGEAGRLDAQRDALREAVRQAARGAAMREDDVRYLVSYFVDAAATSEAAHFETFAARVPAAAVTALRTKAATLA